MTTESTNPTVKGRLPELVSLKRIRPTNTVSTNVHLRPYTPILLVKADDGFYYIVDGNHRFYRKLVLGNQGESILTWVLEEGDQRRLQGDPLSQNVREWKEGEITLTQLSVRAKAAYKAIEREERIALEYLGVVTADKIGNKAIRSAEHRVYDLAEAVVKLLKGVSTIEQEALRLAVPIEELASLHKCFLDGGIRAIRERLQSE